MKSPNIPIKDKTQRKEDLRVTPFRKDIRVTHPHRHNSYFELIFLSGGKGFHTIDHFRYRIDPPMVFLVRKEQLHHFELEEEGEGFVAIIKKSFLDRSLDADLKNMIGRLSAYQCLALKEEKVLSGLLRILSDELSGKLSGNQSFIDGVLKGIIAKILEVAQPVSLNDARSDLYQRFLAELQSGLSMRNAVQHYAALLNTSPQNLSAACRRAVDQSASEVLAEAMIAEAKRLLLYTGNTVAEIAFQLNFSDASNFVRYFKRYTGTTPQKVRLDN